MTIVVCPLSHVPAQVAAHKPDRIISLLDPGTGFPEVGYGARHLRLSFHDVDRAEDWEIAPNMEHMRELIAFTRGWQSDKPLLIHCFAGISRSTASAFIAACALNPDTDERDIARALRTASPDARPNPSLIALADDALGRGGTLRKGFADIYGNWEVSPLTENQPFTLHSRYGGGG